MNVAAANRNQVDSTSVTRPTLTVSLCLLLAALTDGGRRFLAGEAYRSMSSSQKTLYRAIMEQEFLDDILEKEEGWTNKYFAVR